MGQNRKLLDALCLSLLALGVQAAVVPYGRTLSTAAEQAPQQLKSCYNKFYNGTASYFEDFLRGFNTSLYLHEAFVSRKPTDLPLTIFVGATLERLPALEAQCRNYPGPLSAAVYMPLLQQQDGSLLTQHNMDLLQQATATLAQLFNRMEAPPRAPTGGSATSPPPPSCALTLLLLYEVVADPPLAGLVPINSLRNAALLPAATPLVAMVDVDLAPSHSLVDRVLAPRDSSAELLRTCANRSVWVLPAWETHKRLSMEEGTAVAEQAIRGTKAELRQLDEQSRLHFFAMLAYRRGHAATNTSRWLGAGAPYPVQYEVNYEPWFIISRRLVPAYDVRFRGYGWNKVQQVALVALSNFTFWVHPDAWLVHRPHEKSKGQQLYGGSGSGAGSSSGALKQQQQRRQGQEQRGMLEVESGRGSGGGGSGREAGGGVGIKRRRNDEEETRVWQGSRATVARLFHRRVSALRHVAIRDMKRGSYVPQVDPQTQHCRGVLPWWQ